MQRRCPNCKSLNVRRCARERGALQSQPLVRSPYRCRDCRTEFWALGTTTYRRIILGVVMNVTLFALIFGIIMMFES